MATKKKKLGATPQEVVETKEVPLNETTEVVEETPQNSGNLETEEGIFMVAHIYNHIDVTIEGAVHHISISGVDGVCPIFTNAKKAVAFMKKADISLDKLLKLNFNLPKEENNESDADN